MLVVHLLMAVLIGVMAAVLSLRAGFSGGVAFGSYLLGGSVSLALSAAIDRWSDRLRVRRDGSPMGQSGERRRGAVLFLLMSLLAVAGVILASAVDLVPVRTEGRSALLAGPMNPVFGLDHLLALLWLGLWTGRLGDRALWAVPAAFLAGMAAGFGLALGPPVSPLLEAVVHLLVVASLLLLIGAALVPVRLPLPEMASTVALMGGCHGYVHGLEVGGEPALCFGLGTLVSSAALASLGMALGRAVVRGP